MSIFFFSNLDKNTLAYLNLPSISTVGVVMALMFFCRMQSLVLIDPLVEIFKVTALSWRVSTGIITKHRIR